MENNFVLTEANWKSFIALKRRVCQTRNEKRKSLCDKTSAGLNPGCSFVTEFNNKAFFS